MKVVKMYDIIQNTHNKRKALKERALVSISSLQDQQRNGNLQKAETQTD